MVTTFRRLATAAFLLTWASSAGAQTFESVGTRAAGMGGAFVAVADDSSAVYWNPAGLALGNYFTLVADRSTTKVESGEPSQGSRQSSGFLVSMGMPALGLSYYRLSTTTVTPAELPTGSTDDGRQTMSGLVRVDTLVTHNTGATLVQSLVQGVAVGATLKLVHGIASSAVVPDGDRDALLDRAGDLSGNGTNKFDADIGVMAGGGRLKAGLTVRNVTEPSFSIAGGPESLTLERRARAGIAVTPVDGWAVAADFDLMRSGAPDPVRIFALGTEGRIGAKAFVRSGFRLNTTGSARPSVAAGGSYKVWRSLLVDGHATWGSDAADRGWGVATRLVY